MKLFCSKCEKIFSAEKNTEMEAKCPDCGMGQPFPDKFPGPGGVIGDFLIEKSLSKGGMGEVFVARQISLDRPVALKVLQKEYTGDREYIDSLFREARAAAKINHPNIVQAYAVGEDDGNFYFAMELVRGDTMKAVLKREGVLDFKMAAKVICDIAKALDIAWREQKLVHQDIKPDNIMLDNSSGMAKLADLGLAKTGNMEALDEDSDEVFGTPQYISPEQLTGVPTDVRSDIYSLGATFFQFVTGRFPYVAPTAEELGHMHNAGNLEPPKQVNPEVPDELNRIILKMMARNIEARYQTPAPLIDDLEAYLHNSNAAPESKKRGSVPKLTLPRKNVNPVAVSAVVPVEPADKNVSENKTDLPIKSGKFKNTLKVSVIAVVCCVALAGLFIGVIGILGETGVLPERLKPFGESIFGKFVEETDPVADLKTAIAEKNMEQNNVLSEVPVKKEKVNPVRSEYQESLRQLETGNLQKIDELWRDLSVPANETEADLFNKYVEQFGFADESQRVEESRKQLREAHLLLRQRNLQAQRDAKSEAERIRRDYERQQRESEQRSQDEVLRRNRESAGLKKQMLEQVGQCLLAISAVAAGEPDSRTKMEDALQQAKIFRESLLESGAEVQVFADVVNGLPQHINELKQVFARFSALSEKDGVSFNMNRRQRLYVVKIASGQLVCRNNQEQTVIVDIFSQSPEVRRSFFRSLMNNTEIRNAEFYFYLFNRKLPPVKSAPGKFWRKCLTLQ